MCVCVTKSWRFLALRDQDAFVCWEGSLGEAKVELFTLIGEYVDGWTPCGDSAIVGWCGVVEFWERA